MINRIIAWSLHHRFLVISGFLALCAWGVVALKRVPIDAIPDLSENQVIVYADWPGRSPQEVEDQITYPLSSALQGLAGVKSVRATSMFGFSFLTVIFEDQADPYFSRTRVLERLNSLGTLLPAESPPASGPTPPAWAGFTSIISMTNPARRTSARCAPCRIPSSTTSWPGCRASPRSPAWAASSASGRSRSPP